MANTRMPRKLKKFRTSDDNDGSSSWSNLNHDLLLLVMMQVGVFDFIALSGVCKQWRSAAHSNWNKFMVSKQPMSLSISTRLLKKDCYFEDQNKRRKLNTKIPHSNGRRFVGLTCGYLIFYGKKTFDFWLVNPFTGKQLHFPGFLSHKHTYPLDDIRGILVYSPSLFGLVFVVLFRYSCEISFSLAGKKGRWRNVTSNSRIFYLHFFKGKIYVINCSYQLQELRLNPEPAFTVVKMKNVPLENINTKEFVSSGEHIYVRDVSGIAFVAVDFDEMKWVNSERTIGEYAVFLNDFFKSDAAIKPDTWARPSTQYARLNCCQGNMDFPSTRKIWYFPHECLNDKDPDMKIGGLLNILKN